MHMRNGLGPAIRMVATTTTATLAERASECLRMLGEGVQRPALVPTLLMASADLAPTGRSRPTYPHAVVALPPDTVVATVQEPRVGRHRRHNAAVSGIVADPAGHPLAGVTVVLVAPHGAAVGIAVTGTRGGFVVDDVEPGRYRLKALDDGTGDDGTWYRGSWLRRTGTIKVRARKTRRAATLTVPTH